MKVEFVQDVVNKIEPFTTGRNSRDGRSDAKAVVVHLTQLLHQAVCIHPLGTQDRLRVSEDYQDLPGG